MAQATDKAGPYYASGQIKFSSLRSNFRAQSPRSTYSGSDSTATDNNPIKASELLRKTSDTNTDPVVPNSTENANIATSDDWKTSQFRNSIKFYYIRQSGTDLNLDIDALSWNSNFDKNVRKIYFVEGTIGSNSPGTPAGIADAKAVNLRFMVSGNIFGASGRGGGTSGAPAISGETGGDALRADFPSGTENVIIEVISGGKIYAGGGGGEKGKTGNQGSSKECLDKLTASNCGGCPGCPSGYSKDGGCWQGSGCARRRRCNWWGSCWRETSKWTKYQKCQKTFTLNGGAGGAGGNGGPGRGYNNQSGSIGGASGSAGASGSDCNTSGGGGSGAGQTGETGGTGGDWGNTGGNTNNSGSAGNPGRAIFGARYSVVGANSSTIKGSYNP